jgi:hypothetical protein
MKHYLNILIAVLLTASLSANTPNQAEYTYTIHVGAFVNPKLTDFENIRPYGYLYAQKFNNLLQIYMGDYATESEASKTLAQIKQSGYPDAFTTRRNRGTGSSEIIIQLGSEKIGADIDWTYYANAGPLQTFQSGNTIQITTGSFEDLDAANGRLGLIRKSGFNDAFIKNINSVLLHKVTSFETGGGIRIPKSYEEVIIPEAPTEEVVIAEIPPKKNPVPDVMIKQKTPANVDTKKEEPRPTAYEDVRVAKSPPATSVTPVPPAPTTKTATKTVAANTKKAAISTLAVPSIRSDVKRTSVLKLQEVLKTKGSYKSSLDGFFGPGTKKSLKEMMANDQEIQKYKLLSQIYRNDSPKKSDLQTIIYAMDDDVAIAVSKLKKQKTAISKAYQAYGIFALSGENKETDKLMNQAIKESFVGKKLKNKAPFDFKADYSYSDYVKLIRHLRYIHSVSKEDIEVPCWLFEKHKKEALAAFDPANDLDGGDYKIQDCGNITQWESISLMETIMKEMTPDLSDLDATTFARLQSKRAGLMLIPKAQDVEDYKKIDTWNTNLWNGLAKWEASDPLHGKMVSPLKVAYFQSWALLEDHFMNQSFTAKEARGLSLSVLETIVEPYLGRYAE